MKFCPSHHSCKVSDSCSYSLCCFRSASSSAFLFPLSTGSSGAFTSSASDSGRSSAFSCLTSSRILIRIPFSRSSQHNISKTGASVSNARSLSACSSLSSICRPLLLPATAEIARRRTSVASRSSDTALFCRVRIFSVSGSCVPSFIQNTDISFSNRRLMVSFIRAHCSSSAQIPCRKHSCS